jgi:hypothetical protein
MLFISAISSSAIYLNQYNFWYLKHHFFLSTVVCLTFQTQGLVAPPEKTKEDILLFFKLYNPEKEELW